MRVLTLLILLAATVTTANLTSYSYQEIYAKPKRKIRVRVTTYSRDEDGCDRDTRNWRSSTGERLVDRNSAAVDPRRIPYGSRIFICGLKLRAIDTGAWVIANVAARKMRQRVDTTVDIFFNRNADAEEFARNNPLVTDAYVEE